MLTPVTIQQISALEVVMPFNLNSEFWQHGPKWLSLPETEWPTPRVDFSKIDRMEGMKKKHIFTFSTLASLTTPVQHPVNKECTVGNSRRWPTIAELLQIGKNDRISFAKYYSEYRMLIKRTTWVYLRFKEMAQSDKRYEI